MVWTKTRQSRLPKSFRESRPRSSCPSRPGLRAHGWGARVYSHALGQAHSALRLGHFRYERPWLKDERRRKPEPQNLVAEATPQTLVCKREGGLCEGGLRRNEEEPEAGGRIPSSPQTGWRPSPRPAERGGEEVRQT